MDTDSSIFGGVALAPETPAETPASSKQEAVSALYSIPEFAGLGQIFRFVFLRTSLRQHRRHHHLVFGIY